jgi:hypothetical protein
MNSQVRQGRVSEDILFETVLAERLSVGIQDLHIAREQLIRHACGVYTVQAREYAIERLSIAIQIIEDIQLEIL